MGQHINATDLAFIHIARKEMSVERLISVLYHQANPATSDYFKLLNTRLKDGRVLCRGGHPVIVAPPGGSECRPLEFDLMGTVQKLVKIRKTLTVQQTQRLGQYYGLLDNIANTVAWTMACH